MHRVKINDEVIQILCVLLTGSSCVPFASGNCGVGVSKSYMKEDRQAIISQYLKNSLYYNYISEVTITITRHV